MKGVGREGSTCPNVVLRVRRKTTRLWLAEPDCGTSESRTLVSRLKTPPRVCRTFSLLPVLGELLSGVVSLFCNLYVSSPFV